MYLEKGKDRLQRRNKENKKKMFLWLDTQGAESETREMSWYASRKRATGKDSERFIDPLRENRRASESSFSSRLSSRASVEEVNMPSLSSVSRIIRRKKEVGLKIARKNKSEKDLLIKQQKTTMEELKKNSLSIKVDRFENTVNRRQQLFSKATCIP